MTKELTKKIKRSVAGIITISSIIFVESKKFNSANLPKSLYLIFAGYNEKSKSFIRLTYSVTDKSVETKVWAIPIQ